MSLGPLLGSLRQRFMYQGGGAWGLPLLCCMGLAAEGGDGGPGGADQGAGIVNDLLSGGGGNGGLPFLG